MTKPPTPKLLLVDNDEEYLLALRIRLEHAGFACKTAVSGAQGYVAAEAEPFDLIVTDLQMPGGDGVRLVSRIREHSNTPIIVATGFGDTLGPEIDRVPNLNVIVKPFAVDDLTTLIESLLAVCEEH